MDPSSSGNGDAFADLAPMRLRGDSECTNDDLLTSQHAGDLRRNGGNAELDLIEGDADFAHSEPFQRFMRMEINLNEYLQQTGGDVNEEYDMADLDMLEDEEEEEMDEGLPQEPSTSSLVPVKKEERSHTRDDDIPAETRNLVREVITDELHAMKPTPSSGGVVRKKLSDALDALLGQANLTYARGQAAAALNMLLEVIKQEPRQPEAYRLVSTIYQEMDQPQRSLQYGLLAAHLDYNTPASEWSHLGDLSNRLEKFEEAAACYGRATRLEPTNWKHYEKRIKMLDLIGLRPFAMKTRLQAAQSIDQSLARVDFEWFHKLIKTVAEYYIGINDEEKAIQALEAFVLRSREFGRDATAQHETLIGMWMAKNKYDEACKSIYALCPGIKAFLPNGQEAMTVTFENCGFTITPYPLPPNVNFQIDDSFTNGIFARLVVCLVKSGKATLAEEIIPVLLERDNIAETTAEEELLLDIGKAYLAVSARVSARDFLERLRRLPNFAHNSTLWFLLGNALSLFGDTQNAIDAYVKALEIDPGHVDARINLSGLQQRAGFCEEALATLQDHNLDSCTHLPDERLLIRQADAFYERGRYEHFIRCARMLLTPYFYEIHSHPELAKKRLSGKTATSLSTTLSSAAQTALRNTPLERFVKRLGAASLADGRHNDLLDATQLHDYSLRLIERLESLERYNDMMAVCCYAYLQPKIQRAAGSANFRNMLYYCAIRAKDWTLAFEFVRWYHMSTLNDPDALEGIQREVIFRRILNGMNYVFCHSQSVSYHRYIARSLAKAPGNHALQAISGNNSLVTGTYRHALGEYLRVWANNQKHPLVCLLIALTFVHMGCKKDLSSRHLLIVRGLAFLKRYVDVRTVTQEADYNLGRVFHQLNMMTLAIHFYKKVLYGIRPRVLDIDPETGDESAVLADKYDLRPLAAHNLAMIYKSSGNVLLARRVLEEFCTV
ncbi:unnamed protein product, partial [Mesorhabditis spiculigera]